MKRQAMKQATGSYINQIEKHSRRIPGAFAEEDIHDLRVAYKKLRAWLRLLQGGTGAVCLPDDLKELYRAAGRVRDEQLLLQRIQAKTATAQSLPVFTQYIQKRLFADKEQLVKVIEQIHFKKVTHAINESLPATWHDELMSTFLQVKSAAIRLVLLAGIDDQGLHAGRKHLKDILYNGKTLQTLDIALPVAGWPRTPRLQQATERLGEFNDHCNTEYWLQATDMELPPEERMILNQWMQEWGKQKEPLKNELWSELGHLVSRK